MAEARIPDAETYHREIRHHGAEPRARAKPGALVMHPGPMNRGVEIADEVADGPQSVIQQQVANGVAVRMAVARDHLLRRRQGADPEPARGDRRMTGREHRGTIFVEDAEVRVATGISRAAVRDAAARAALRRGGRAGQLRTPVLRCASCPMRRPLSIMLADAAAGTIDILYKVVGTGLEKLVAQPVGARLSVHRPDRTRLHAAAEPPARAADRRRRGHPADGLPRRRAAASPDARWRPLVLMGSEIPFPFRARPSTLLVPGMPAGVDRLHAAARGLGVPSRLASLAGLPGCYDGYVTALADAWLDTLDADTRGRGRDLRLRPDADAARRWRRVARRYGVPAQVSLEEFMACAVGGCAGCAVPILVDGELAMKRVCVDGPVFDANAVFPEKETDVLSDSRL